MLIIDVLLTFQQKNLNLNRETNPATHVFHATMGKVDPSGSSTRKG